MVKLYKCVISFIDISTTFNIATLGIMPLHKNERTILSVGLLTDLCSIELNLDKTRVEKKQK